MADKNHILAEIRRTASENDGKPLGMARFFSETGIKITDWQNKFWARWSDALREAGFEPNSLNRRLSDAPLLGSLAGFVRELGHLPSANELKLRAHQDPAFPDNSTFVTHFGRKARWAAALARYCEERGGFEDVIEYCAQVRSEGGDDATAAVKPVQEEHGWVYLLKSGRNYKIGRTNSVGRRVRELEIQLPEKAQEVHHIATDDPVGIEAYWHERFKDRRKNGEWFELSASDVAAFKRRKKFM